MKPRIVSLNTLNKYLKKYAPERFKDYRKPQYKYLSKDYINQLKNDDLNYIQNVVSNIDNEKIKEQKRIRNEKQREYREQKKDIKYNDKINKYFEDNIDKIMKLRDGNNEFKFNINDIKRLPEKYEKIFLEKVLNRVKNVSRFTNNAVIRIKIDDDYYGIGGEGLMKLLNGLKGELNEYAIDSDEYIYTLINKINRGSDINFISTTKEARNRRRVGAFFKYYNITSLDLTKYQITDGINNDKNKNINIDNCLIYALKLLGVKSDKLSIIKNYVINAGSKSIPTSKLNEICNKINIRIELKSLRNTQTERDKTIKNIYGTSGDIYKICLLDEHYFIYEDRSGITSYFINNYDKLKYIENGSLIYKINSKGRYEKDMNRTLNSFDLVLKLLENNEKFFIKIDSNNINLYDEPFTNNYDFKLNEYDDLSYCKDYSIKNTNIKDLKSYKIRELEEYGIIDDENIDCFDRNELKEDKQQYINVFFDFETYTEKQIINKKECNIHKPYLVSFKIPLLTKDKIISFTGDECGKEFLNYLYKIDTRDYIDNYNIYSGRHYKTHYRLIAHNAKYDMRFLIKYLYRCKELNNGTSLISFSGVYGFEKKNKIKINIKDSYKLIPTKLSAFPNMFFTDYEVIKEVMNYNYYNKETLSRVYNPLNEILEGIENIKDKEQFKNNCLKWDCYENNKNNSVDILKYSIKYCEIDVDILSKGYEIFREWCVNDLNIDINDVLTIPTMAFKYLRNEGCYDYCKSLSGLPREFIAKSCRGGRTMSNNNKLYVVIDKILNDFDAVSLYPSAMVRLDGFLKGAPIELMRNELNYDIIKSYDFYFVEIEILKVGIKRMFPLMSKIDPKTKSRDYTNDMIGERIIVNKIDLEDLINFQKVEFKILRGYKYVDGFNTKIKEVIEYLFKKRKELKKAGNKSQELYKLLMNASYGKLIQKAGDKEVRFFDTLKDFNKFYEKYYNEMIKATNYDNENPERMRAEIKTATGDFFTEPHLGSQILSMSKRIMNEVMCLAEDLNLMMYYQDTDSIHIEDKSIEILQEAYKNKYNKDLIGSNMGQFHSDFNDVFSINGEKIKVNNVVSKKLIILGKKSYIDELEGIDDNGNIHKNYHIRMKGISYDAIEDYQKKHNKEYKDIYEIYEYLSKGNSITFDLTAGGKKMCLEYLSGYKINTKDRFERVVKFMEK